MRRHSRLGRHAGGWPTAGRTVDPRISDGYRWPLIPAQRDPDLPVRFEAPKADANHGAIAGLTQRSDASGEHDGELSPLGFLGQVVDRVDARERLAIEPGQKYRI